MCTTVICNEVLGVDSFSAEVSSLTCRKGGAYDNYGTKIELFKEVRTVFTELKELDIPLAAASR